MADKEADGSWAIKLLTRAPEETTSFFSAYNSTIWGGVAGLISAFFVNYGSRRPPWSGIQKHLAFPIIGAGLARLWEIHVENRLARRDAIYRHYISLHPEDFPEPERKKFKEIIMEWTPIR